MRCVRRLENTLANIQDRRLRRRSQETKYFPWDFDEYRDFKVRGNPLLSVRVFGLLTIEFILDRQLQERALCVPHVLYRAGYRCSELRGCRAHGQ